MPRRFRLGLTPFPASVDNRAGVLLVWECRPNMRFALLSRCLIAAALHAGVRAHAAETDAVPVLTCEQIYEIVKDAARYRNQGQTLDQVLRGMKDVEAKQPLAPLEGEALRKAVSLVYLGEAAPEEIALECIKSRKKK